MVAAEHCPMWIARREATLRKPCYDHAMRSWVVVWLVLLGCQSTKGTKDSAPACDAFGRAHEEVAMRIRTARKMAAEAMASTGDDQKAAWYCERMVHELLLVNGYVRGF